MGFELKISFGSSKKEEPKPLVVVQPAPEQNVKVVSEPVDFDFEKNYGDAIREIFKAEELKYAALDGKKGEMPITAGRVSSYEAYQNYIPNDHSPVPTNFDFKNLRLLANLGMYNRHVSMAIENIVSLGNTDYDIDFGTSVGSKQSGDMIKYLSERVKTWYEFSDGEESLDNDLLVQAAVYGAISAEAVIMPNLRGISKIVRVDPYYIRFAYDKKTDTHTPLQQVGGVLGATNSKYPGYIELNPNTYSYIAMRRMGEMPYAVPPFLSALEDIFIENDMIKNFQNMMRRLGMLGFLSVLLKAPQQVGNETPDQYKVRLGKYLDDVRGPIEKGFSRGVAIGYQGQHDFKLEGTTLNSGNGENLLKMVKTLIFSGLKQDPNLHGENYATTETFGRVIMEKMTAQVINFQKPVATYKSNIFFLELLMAGFKVREVNVTYHKPSTHDKLREQAERTVLQANVTADYEAGLIDQNTRAQKLGYDKPAEKEPRISPETKAANKAAAMAPKKGPVKKKLKISLPEFNYNIPDGCNYTAFDQADDDNIDPKLLALIIAYLNSIRLIYENAVENAYSRLLKDFGTLPANASLADVQSRLIGSLLEKWERDYVPEIEAAVDKNISKLYSKFRKDKTIFNGQEAPKATLTLLDAKAITFIEDMDKYYLAKFITDSDTLNRFRAWIKEQYDNGKIPLNGSKTDIRNFISEFSDIIEKESWKVDRIVSTSSALARNFASLSYLNQAGIDEYEVQEVMDDRTCRFCQHMNGMKFSVSRTMDNFESMFKKGIDSLSKYKPFATTFKIDEFEQMEPDKIFEANISIPPYHPKCRGIVVPAVS